MKEQGRGARGVGRGGAIGAALVLLASMASAEVPVVVTTRVEPQTVRIGSPFRYYVRVETKGEAEVVMPLLVDRIGDFLIRDYGESAAADGVASERWYELVGYAPGVQLVDGGSIAYRVAGGDLENVEVPDAVITVESMLDGMGEAQLAAADLRDIRGPIGVPEPAPPWWVAAAALALIAAAAFALRRWWRREAAAPPPPPRPAHEVALEDLAALRRARLLEEGRPADFYVSLSAIVRTYVEGRFRLRAPEMTTQEFLQAAQSNRELPAGDRGRLNDFLREADLVKFARHVPTPEQGERAWEAAREFVSRTAQVAEEPHAAA